MLSIFLVSQMFVKDFLQRFATIELFNFAPRGTTLEKSQKIYPSLILDPDFILGIDPRLGHKDARGGGPVGFRNRRRMINPSEIFRPTQIFSSEGVPVLWYYIAARHGTTILVRKSNFLAKLRRQIIDTSSVI